MQDNLIVKSLDQGFGYKRPILSPLIYQSWNMILWVSLIYFVLGTSHQFEVFTMREWSKKYFFNISIVSPYFWPPDVGLSMIPEVLANFSILLRLVTLVAPEEINPSEENVEKALRCLIRTWIRHEIPKR